LKVVTESHVTWATSVPILVFLGLSVLDLCPTFATDTSDVRQKHRLIKHAKSPGSGSPAGSCRFLDAVPILYRDDYMHLQFDCDSTACDHLTIYVTTVGLHPLCVGCNEA